MLKPEKYLACLVVLIGLSTGELQAASSAASSASESITTSVGSASGSLQTSSGSSSKGHDFAEGDYRIVAVAASDRPGSVRIKLQALAGNTENNVLLLTMPQAAFDNGRLAEGRTVTARKRSYGAEFANTATREVFFLVLDDDWHRELRTNAVDL